MLLLTCPICTISADEHAFTCGGDAHVVRPQTSNPSYVAMDRLSDYLNLVPSIRGWCRENWLCHGCNGWFVLLRHSETNEIAAAYRIGDQPPPAPGAAA